MKKLITIFFLIVFMVCVAFIGVYLSDNDNNSNNNSYLRIHIRANSNLQVDQEVKYKVKDAIVEYLTPEIALCNSKEDFLNCLNKNLINIECIANQILAQNSFDYKSSARINSEYFPTRSYDTLTLESGFYDALIINLGSGKGDNWWCVVYPPLCFVNYNTNNVYKSRILEILKKYFGR